MGRPYFLSMKHTRIAALLLAPLALLQAADSSTQPNNGVRPYPAASVTRIASFRRI